MLQCLSHIDSRFKHIFIKITYLFYAVWHGLNIEIGKFESALNLRPFEGRRHRGPGFWSHAVGRSEGLPPTVLQKVKIYFISPLFYIAFHTCSFRQHFMNEVT